MNHHEQVVAVLLQLRPLVDVQAVLDRQRVETETFGQDLQRRLVLDRRSIQRIVPGGGGVAWSASPTTAHGPSGGVEDPQLGGHRPSD